MDSSAAMSNSFIDTSCLTGVSRVQRYYKDSSRECEHSESITVVRRGMVRVNQPVTIETERAESLSHSTRHFFTVSAKPSSSKDFNGCVPSSVHIRAFNHQLIDADLIKSATEFASAAFSPIVVSTAISLIQSNVRALNCLRLQLFLAAKRSNSTLTYETESDREAEREYESYMVTRLIGLRDMIVRWSLLFDLVSCEMDDYIEMDRAEKQRSHLLETIEVFDRSITSCASLHSALNRRQLYIDADSEQSERVYVTLSHQIADRWKKADQFLMLLEADVNFLRDLDRITQSLDQLRIGLAVTQLNRLASTSGHTSQVDCDSDSDCYFDQYQLNGFDEDVDCVLEAAEKTNSLPLSSRNPAVETDRRESVIKLSKHAADGSSSVDAAFSGATQYSTSLSSCSIDSPPQIVALEAEVQKELRKSQVKECEHVESERKLVSHTVQLVATEKLEKTCQPQFSLNFTSVNECEQVVSQIRAQKAVIHPSSFFAPRIFIGCQPIETEHFESISTRRRATMSVTRALQPPVKLSVLVVINESSSVTRINPPTKVVAKVTNYIGATRLTLDTLGINGAKVKPARKEHVLVETKCRVESVKETANQNADVRLWRAPLDSDWPLDLPLVDDDESDWSDLKFDLSNEIDRLDRLDVQASVDLSEDRRNASIRLQVSSGNTGQISQQPTFVTKSVELNTSLILSPTDYASTESKNCLFDSPTLNNRAIVDSAYSDCSQQSLISQYQDQESVDNTLDSLDGQPSLNATRSCIPASQVDRGDSTRILRDVTEVMIEREADAVKNSSFVGHVTASTSERSDSVAAIQENETKSRPNQVNSTAFVSRQEHSDSYTNQDTGYQRDVTTGNGLQESERQRRRSRSKKGALLKLCTTVLSPSEEGWFSVSLCDAEMRETETAERVIVEFHGFAPHFSENLPVENVQPIDDVPMIVANCNHSLIKPIRAHAAVVSAVCSFESVRFGNQMPLPMTPVVACTSFGGFPALEISQQAALEEADQPIFSAFRVRAKRSKQAENSTLTSVADNKPMLSSSSLRLLRVAEASQPLPFPAQTQAKISLCSTGSESSDGAVRARNCSRVRAIDGLQMLEACETLDSEIDKLQLPVAPSYQPHRSCWPLIESAFVYPLNISLYQIEDDITFRLAPTRAEEDAISQSEQDGNQTADWKSLDVVFYSESDLASDPVQKECLMSVVAAERRCRPGRSQLPEQKPSPQQSSPLDSDTDKFAEDLVTRKKRPSTQRDRQRQEKGPSERGARRRSWAGQMSRKSLDSADAIVDSSVPKTVATRPSFPLLRRILKTGGWTIVGIFVGWSAFLLFMSYEQREYEETFSCSMFPNIGVSADRFFALRYDAPPPV